MIQFIEERKPDVKYHVENVARKTNEIAGKLNDGTALILTAPNGTQYSLSVDNAGALSTTVL